MVVVTTLLLNIKQKSLDNYAVHAHKSASTEFGQKLENLERSFWNHKSSSQVYTRRNRLLKDPQFQLGTFH